MNGWIVSSSWKVCLLAPSSLDKVKYGLFIHHFQTKRLHKKTSLLTNSSTVFGMISENLGRLSSQV